MGSSVFVLKRHYETKWDFDESMIENGEAVLDEAEKKQFETPSPEEQIFGLKKRLGSLIEGLLLGRKGFMEAEEKRAGRRGSEPLLLGSEEVVDYPGDLKLFGFEPSADVVETSSSKMGLGGSSLLVDSSDEVDLRLFGHIVDEAAFKKGLASCGLVKKTGGGGMVLQSDVGPLVSPSWLWRLQVLVILML